MADTAGMHGALTDMAAAVDAAMRGAVAALEAADEPRAAGIVSADAEIDRQEQAVERLCIQALAQPAPRGRSAERAVRHATAVLKCASDLERAGDHAAGIARSAVRMGREPRIRPVLDISRMSELAAQTLVTATEAFVRADVDAARRAAERDDAVDALYDQVLRELITTMLDDRAAVRQAQHLLFVASHIERIGDYGTNIAEWAVYVETGQRVELNG